MLARLANTVNFKLKSKGLITIAITYTISGVGKGAPGSRGVQGLFITLLFIYLKQSFQLSNAFQLGMDGIPGEKGPPGKIP